MRAASVAFRSPLLARSTSMLMRPAALTTRTCPLSASSSRPFRVLGLQQIAIGALDKAPLSALWEGALGVPKVGTYASERENVDEDIHKLGVGPWAVEVDLMMPIDPAKSPKVHVPTLNHIGLWVDELQSAVDHLTAAGARFTPGGIRKGASGFDVCFLHPKGSDALPISGEGVLIELVQAPPEVIAAYDEAAGKGAS